MIKYLKVDIDDENYDSVLESIKNENIEVEEFDSSLEMFMYEEAVSRINTLECIQEKEIDKKIKEQIIDEASCALCNDEYVIDSERSCNIINSRIIELVPDFFE